MRVLILLPILSPPPSPHRISHETLVMWRKIRPSPSSTHSHTHHCPIRAALDAADESSGDESSTSDSNHLNGPPALQQLIALEVQRQMDARFADLERRMQELEQGNGPSSVPMSRDPTPSATYHAGPTTARFSERESGASPARCTSTARSCQALPLLLLLEALLPASTAPLVA